MPSATATPAAIVSSGSASRPRPQDRRDVDAGAGWRCPAAAEPSATRRLCVRGDDTAFRSALALRATRRHRWSMPTSSYQTSRCCERTQSASAARKRLCDVVRNAALTARMVYVATRGSISKLRSTAGAECVSAPTDTKSAPVAASSRHALQRDAAGDLRLRAAAAALARPR